MPIEKKMTCLHVDKINTPSGCVCQECGLLFSSETLVDTLAQNSRSSHKKKKLFFRSKGITSNKIFKENKNCKELVEKLAQKDSVKKGVEALIKEELSTLRFNKNQNALSRAAFTLISFYKHRVKQPAKEMGFEEFRSVLKLNFSVINTVKRHCDFHVYEFVPEEVFIKFETDVVFNQMGFEAIGHEWIVRLHKLIPVISSDFDSTPIKVATVYYIGFAFGVDVRDRVESSDQFQFLFKILSLAVLKLTTKEKDVLFAVSFLPSPQWVHYSHWKDSVYNFLEHEMSSTEPHQLQRFF
jgi:hypothetical protein